MMMRMGVPMGIMAGSTISRRAARVTKSTLLA